MALPLSNSFETGLADETAVTAGNSGGTAGDAFDAIGGSIVFDTAQAAHGTLSGRFVVASAVVANIDWSTAIGTVTTLYTRLYIYRTAHPSGSQRLIRFKNSSNVDTCYVTHFTDGTLFVTDAAGASTGTTNVVTLNTWMRIESKLVAHASTGIIEAKLFTGDSTSAVETITRSSVNTGADIDVLAIGNTTAINCGSFWLDDLAASGTAYVGPYVSAAETQSFYAARRRSVRR